MPVSPTYPGVYIEEIPSGVRTITGVSTSTTAFVGRALKGPVNEPTIISSFADFQRQFGGLWIDSAMSFAVNQFYANGGGTAVIVRVFGGPPQIANFALTDTVNILLLEASSPGTWANDLTVTADNLTAPFVAGKELINLTVRRAAPIQHRLRLCAISRSIRSREPTS